MSATSGHPSLVDASAHILHLVAPISLIGVDNRLTTLGAVVLLTGVVAVGASVARRQLNPRRSNGLPALNRARRRSKGPRATG